ncbi:MAG: hypothetical protein N2235_20445 [Fischerella sp.]|nr:hypothetical protein [Fischerella sp.]
MFLLHLRDRKSHEQLHWRSTCLSAIGSATELITSSEGKTDCKRLNSDDWGGYERILPVEIQHYQ